MSDWVYVAYHTVWHSSYITPFGTGASEVELPLPTRVRVRVRVRALSRVRVRASKASNTVGPRAVVPAVCSVQYCTSARAMGCSEAASGRGRAWDSG